MMIRLFKLEKLTNLDMVSLLFGNYVMRTAVVQIVRFLGLPL